MEQEWLVSELNKNQKKANSYEENAFFQELVKICVEQNKRILQAREELDGSLWSPKKW